MEMTLLIATLIKVDLNWEMNRSKKLWACPHPTSELRVFFLQTNVCCPFGVWSMPTNMDFWRDFNGFFPFFFFFKNGGYLDRFINLFDDK